MDKFISFSQIQLSNFLSFGPEGIDIPLNPLNVFIGPNASGKSNLIEAFRIIRAAPNDNIKPISDGGGTEAYLWKGEGSREKVMARILMAISSFKDSYVYFQEFSCDHYGLFQLLDESIIEGLAQESGPAEVYWLSQMKGGPRYKGKPILTGLGEHIAFNRNRSILSQLQDRKEYPEISHLRSIFSRILIYEGWPLGKSFPPRHPQPADLAGVFLDEDASNLSKVINKLENRVDGIKETIVANLQRIYPSIKNVTTEIIEGNLYLRFHEVSQKKTIPAIRQSDGVLRYLCLLTILLHPEPPPLICLEEPEIGLHPDAIGILGGLLKEASKRTQLIVTTHSDILISELSDTPESVIICDRDDRGTNMTRLDPDKLEKWLKDYSLGHLWLRGDLGGTL